MARHRRAIAIAEARREGHTWIRIATMFGVTRQRLVQILTSACPPFFPPAFGERPPRRAVSDVRPAWSYPDEELLRLARDGRAEIAAAERARRFG